MEIHALNFLGRIVALLTKMGAKVRKISEYTYYIAKVDGEFYVLAKQGFRQHPYIAVDMRTVKTAVFANAEEVSSPRSVPELEYIIDTERIFYIKIVLFDGLPTILDDTPYIWSNERDFCKHSKQMELMGILNKIKLGLL